MFFWGASSPWAPAAPRLGKRRGRAGVCLLKMKGFCAGSACGSWAPRQRTSSPALLPPAAPKRAPVLLCAIDAAKQMEAFFLEDLSYGLWNEVAAAGA